MDISIESVQIVVPSSRKLGDVQGTYDSIVERQWTMNVDESFPSVKLGSKLPDFEDVDFDAMRLPPAVMSIMNKSCRYSVVCALLALEAKGFIDRNSEDPWTLPPHLRHEVGVIYASSYSHHSAALGNVAAHERQEAQSGLIQSIRNEYPYASLLLGRFFQRILDAFPTNPQRKVALQLTLGLQANTQLSQIIKAKGPNLFSSTACASTTTAIKLACNELRLREAKYMVVLSGDAVLSDGCISLVESFASLQAASRVRSLRDAIRPFSTRPTGFVFGEAAVAMILSRDAPGPCVRVVASKIGNAAHHGTNLDAAFIAHVVREAVLEACRAEGIAIDAFATDCLYVSHDTFTKICAAAEVDALTQVFGPAVARLTITNSKQSTGHTMGAGVEDIVAILALQSGVAPPVPRDEIEPSFQHLRFADGAKSTYRRAVHVACGIGSHVACVVYAI